MYLDLYAKPEASLGQEVSVNGNFSKTGGTVAGWQLSAAGSEMQSDGRKGTTLHCATVQLRWLVSRRQGQPCIPYRLR